MMNWKGFGKKRSWPNFKLLSRYLSGVTEEKLKNHSQNSRSPGPGLNPGPSKSVNHSTTTFSSLLETLIVPQLV
jgi:hypothetical protein